MKPLQITVDLTNIECADDGNTMYYGGVYKVGEKELQAHGTDRDGGYDWDLEAELVRQGVDSVALFNAQIDDDASWWANRIFKVTQTETKVTIKRVRKAKSRTLNITK